MDGVKLNKLGHGRQTRTDQHLTHARKPSLQMQKETIHEQIKSLRT